MQFDACLLLHLCLHLFEQILYICRRRTTCIHNEVGVFFRHLSATDTLNGLTGQGLDRTQTKVGISNLPEIAAGNNSQSPYDSNNGDVSKPKAKPDAWGRN